ncbi:MAG: nucleotidyl transferase AbiEii/AbiGii toxin family protein [Gammaproteobacteria bacterium (ex Lamellibrachia satsuma)]|nr:MAG: nucleotidyl transferase AbiEii/AbiGii toxin family protein [Gammaproteobacteria bacterium (ex Lamellibrachia satsuma)]
MIGKRGRNTAASVRDRLLELARQRGEEFQLILTRYGLERLLYRLSQSEYRNRFILKGAMLFTLWDDQMHRPTRDVDFLGFGDSGEAALREIFRNLCNLPVEDDGLVFLADSVGVESILDAAEYGGTRVVLLGELAGARIPIQADIGFGDAVTPEPEEVEYPTLLGYPMPRLWVYPRETVVAEKYQALVNLGMANSRMKDFYDLWIMAHQFEFDGLILSEAICNTFVRRQTPLPKQTPSGLNSTFYDDKQKNLQWNAFLSKGMLLSTSTPPSIEEVCHLLETFLMQPTQALKDDQAFTGQWPPGGPWRI